MIWDDDDVRRIYFLWLPLKLLLFLLCCTTWCLVFVSSRRRRASPSASQTWRLWPRPPELRPQPKASLTPNSLFLAETFIFLLQNKQFPPERLSLCVYSIYTSADGKIKALLFILNWLLWVCVFISQPSLFLALIYSRHVFGEVQPWIYSFNSLLLNLIIA